MTNCCPTTWRPLKPNCGGGSRLCSRIIPSTLPFITLVLTLLLSLISCSTTWAQESDELIRSSLENGAYPWYNAETDSTRMPEINDRMDSDLIAKRDKVKHLPTTTKPIPAPAAGGGPAAATPGMLSGIVWIVGGILLAAIIGLLIYAFLRIESEEVSQSSGSKRRSIQDHIERLPFEVEAQTGDFATAAEQAYRQGDFRKAIIYLFGDVLVELDQESLIRLRKGKTNRQYYREIRKHKELTGFYRNVMTSFEDVFFGQHEIEKARVDQCFEQWKTFRSDLKAIAEKRFAATPEKLLAGGVA